MCVLVACPWGFNLDAVGKTAQSPSISITASIKLPPSLLHNHHSSWPHAPLKVNRNNEKKLGDAAAKPGKGGTVRPGGVKRGVTSPQVHYGNSP